MADLSITVANVLAGVNAKKALGIAGATITAGQVVYQDPADSKFKLADNNGVAAAQVPFGIALHASLAGQPLTVLTCGDLTLGATMVAGTVYYLSATPGGVCPVADLVAGMKPSALGIASSTTVLKVDIQQSGVTL